MSDAFTVLPSILSLISHPSSLSFFLFFDFANFFPSLSVCLSLSLSLLYHCSHSLSVKLVFTFAYVLSLLPLRPEPPITRPVSL